MRRKRKEMTHEGGIGDGLEMHKGGGGLGEVGAKIRRSKRVKALIKTSLYNYID